MSLNSSFRGATLAVGGLLVMAGVVLAGGGSTAGDASASPSASASQEALLTFGASVSPEPLGRSVLLAITVSLAVGIRRRRTRRVGLCVPVRIVRR